MAYLREKGFPVLDLTDNELAKLHIRHMVGGHAVKVSDEMVFRFEFPERPGALFNFLTKLGGRWNISMFHYRNHGAADGRVVAGLQVPEDERHLIHADPGGDRLSVLGRDRQPGLPAVPRLTRGGSPTRAAKLHGQVVSFLGN